MHVDAGDRDAGQGRSARVDVPGAADRDAELVFGLAGGDLGVGFCVDVRVHADRDRRAARPLPVAISESDLELCLRLRR